MTVNIFYQLQTASMVEMLQARGVMHVVDGAKSEDEVFAAVCAVYDSVVASS